jgi:outer membrane protein assembly factor BamB
MIRYSIFFTALICFFIQTVRAQEISSKYNRNWPQWRGPESTGVALTGNPPIEWSETKNVKWKIEIPGKGHATPIIWEDKVFILTAVETDQKIEKEEPEAEVSTGRRRMPGLSAESVLEFLVMAINRTDGSVLWKKSVIQEAPIDGTHATGSWASNSPVTDGEHLYAYFGSRGLYCMDFDGNILWSRDFGQMEKKMSFGEGSSPALHNDKIVVLWDHEGDSFLYILDKKTGKDILKIARDEATSWSSPLIVNANGKDQVITSATKQIRSYDIETGDIIWHDTGMTSNVIPHPIVNQGILYLMSGFRGNAIKAIDLSKAKGNINGTNAIVWEYNQNASYTPSALLDNDKLYFLRTNNGSLTCLDATDGKENYSLEKLEGTGTVFASPVGAQDRLYVTSQSGITYVIKQGSNFEILAKNVLDDGNFASPSIAGNELYIRGFQYLYCLSEE